MGFHLVKWMIQLTIIGNPISQARPRLSLRGAYNPNSKQKLFYKWDAASQMREKGFKMLQDAPIEVEMTFHSPMTERTLKSQKKAFLQNGSYDTRNKDIDNYAKFYLDVLKGVVYSDDRFVVKLKLEKRKSLNPRTVIIAQNIQE